MIRSLVSLAWAFQTAGGFAFAQQTRPADQPLPAATLEAHVRQLGDYRYAVRNEATAALSTLNPVNLPQLLNYYLQEHRHEPKLRLRYAIEQVFYRQMMAGESGFLGIRLREFQVWDPRAGQVTASVVVDEVQPGMAAEKGGMRDLDIILDFGGQPVAALMNPAAAPKRKEEPLGAEQFARGFASPELLAFMNHVKQTRPGTPLPLRVLRAVETRKVRLPPGVTDTGGLALTQLPFPLDRMYVERAVAGFAVAAAADKPWARDAGLGRGDVIIGVDGQPFRSDASVEQFEQFLRSARQEMLLEVRRFEQVPLTVTLGERPPELMNAADWEPAQKRFAAWWREQVGEPSVRVRKPAPVLYLTNRPVLPPIEAELLP